MLTYPMFKVKKFIIKHKLVLFLILFALLLRLPWLYATMERDEGIFGFVTTSFLAGESIYVLDNKPPLLYILYALPITIFGNSIIHVRIFNNLLFFISIIFFFSLIRSLYGKKIALFSSIAYIIFMNIPAYEGPLAVSESFMIPFCITSIYFLNLFLKKQKIFYLGISIILMCAASLIRHNALGGLLLIYFLTIKKNKLDYKKILLMISPLIFFLCLITYFLYTGQIPYILKSISYIRMMIPFSYTLLAILESYFILFFSFLGIVIILKNKQTKKYSLIFLWLLFLLPFLLFPISFHHLLTLVPPLAVFAGIGFNIFIKNKKEKITIILCTLLMIISLFPIVKQYPDYNLKINKLKYADLNNYKEQIQISNYIKEITYPEDRILVWGFEPGIYWLSGRSLSKQIEFTHGYNTAFSICYESQQTNKNQEEVEQEFLSQNIKVFVFLPGRNRRCPNFDKEIFSDVLRDYNKKWIYDTEIYYK